ncbi:peptidyl-tRNA hydrolase [Dactylosporangium aurantiacum]|uniref:peptidyl-tRNA hydrolase n=1 Tax=Dactylosporangium aurantiacum TaxID=35754 RepID=UPI0036F1D364
MVTRADLPPGIQATQATHAALDFAVAHPDTFRDWHAGSNTLVLVAARDEDALDRLRVAASAAGHRHVGFREPDLGGALTALAVEPAAYRLLSHLPLALRPASGGARSPASGGAHEAASGGARRAVSVDGGGR